MRMMVLMQAGMDARTRSFGDCDVEEESIGGELGSAVGELYEQYLQRVSDVPVMTYSIGEIIMFVDEMPDLSVLLFDPHHNVYLPYNKDWIKQKI